MSNTVLMVAPSGFTGVVSATQSTPPQSGQTYTPDASGLVLVDPKDVAAMERAGFETVVAGAIQNLNAQKSLAGVGSTADTAETTLFTYSLPANSLAKFNRGVRVTVEGAAGAGNNTKTLRVKFGSGVAFNVGLGTIANQGFRAVLDVFKGSAVSLQMAQGIAQLGSSAVASPVLPGAEDETAAIVIKATGQGVAVNDVVGNLYAVDALN